MMKNIRNVAKIRRKCFHGAELAYCVLWDKI